MPTVFSIKACILFMYHMLYPRLDILVKLLKNYPTNSQHRVTSFGGCFFRAGYQLPGPHSRQMLSIQSADSSILPVKNFTLNKYLISVVMLCCYFSGGGFRPCCILYAMFQRVISKQYNVYAQQLFTT